MSALFIYDSKNWFKQANICAAMSMDALIANLKPLNKLIHEVRGFQGAIKSSKSLRKCLEDGDLIKKETKLTITKRPILEFYQIWIWTEIDL